MTLRGGEFAQFFLTIGGLGVVLCSQVQLLFSSLHHLSQRLSGLPCRVAQRRPDCSAPSPRPAGFRPSRSTSSVLYRWPFDALSSSLMRTTLPPERPVGSVRDWNVRRLLPTYHNPPPKKVVSPAWPVGSTPLRRRSAISPCHLPIVVLQEQHRPQAPLRLHRLS